MEVSEEFFINLLKQNQLAFEQMLKQNQQVVQQVLQHALAQNIQNKESGIFDVDTVKLKRVRSGNISFVLKKAASINGFNIKYLDKLKVELSGMSAVDITNHKSVSVLNEKLSKYRSEDIGKVVPEDERDKVIKKKKEEFTKLLKPFVETYGKDMVNDFYRHWVEPNKTGKLKYELQKTWDLKLRLLTWSKNQSNFKRKQLPQQPAPQKREMLGKENPVKPASSIPESVKLESEKPSGTSV